MILKIIDIIQTRIILIWFNLLLFDGAIIFRTMVKMIKKRCSAGS